MEQCRNIDTTLTERHGILNLLESLKREDITVEEMEKIGAKLQKAGKRALFPLLRRLWREKNDNFINRYVYLLDFFDDNIWLDQLMRIAIKRNDLGEDGKAAVLTMLEDCGVDISAPPFVRVLEEISGPFETALPKLLDKGDDGLVRFMEDFLSYQHETRLAVIERMESVDHPQVVTLLGVLMGFDNREVVCQTINTLGRIRDRRSAFLLSSFEPGDDAELRALTERNLRRLSFLGIVPDSPPASKAVHNCFVSPVDGTGNRSLCFSRLNAEGRLDVLFMHIHEKKGLLDALGYIDITRDRFEGLIADISGEEAIFEVDSSYAVLLVKDALASNARDLLHLPPEFYVWRGILPKDALVPAQYIPKFPGYDLSALSRSSDLVADAGLLFEEEYFDGWFNPEPRLFDLAEEFKVLEKGLSGRELTLAVEGFIKKFISEVVDPATERLTRRLFLVADLMIRTGREKELIEKTLAVALSLSRNRGFRQRNQFLRQFALESLRITREALAEGLDLRGQTDEWGTEDELWD